MQLTPNGDLCKKKKIMIDNQIPVFPWLFEVRSLMFHYWAFVVAGNDTVVTSLKETICSLLISIWLGSKKGESILCESNPSSLETFSKHITPEWNFMDPWKQHRHQAWFQLWFQRRSCCAHDIKLLWWCHNKSWTHSSQCLVMAVKTAQI